MGHIGKMRIINTNKNSTIFFLMNHFVNMLEAINFGGLCCYKTTIFLSLILSRRRMELGNTTIYRTRLCCVAAVIILSMQILETYK